MRKKSKRLVIVGCGGFGRETLDWALHAQSNATTSEYEDICMVDKKKPDFNFFPQLQPVYNGTLIHYVPQQNDFVVIAIGDGIRRSEVDNILRNKQANFGSVIHPTALISTSSHWGDGAIVAPHVVVTSDVEVGRHAHMNIATSIGHDVKIGNFVTLSSHIDVTGGCEVGDFGFLGSGACILPNCKIAPKSRIGAGCVVTRSVSKPTVFLPPISKKVVFE